jgi:hypothetical protein
MTPPLTIRPDAPRDADGHELRAGDAVRLITLDHEPVGRITGILDHERVSILGHGPHPAHHLRLLKHPDPLERRTPWLDPAGHPIDYLEPPGHTDPDHTAALEPPTPGQRAIDRDGRLLVDGHPVNLEQRLERLERRGGTTTEILTRLATLEHLLADLEQRAAARERTHRDLAARLERLEQRTLTLEQLTSALAGRPPAYRPLERRVAALEQRHHPTPAELAAADYALERRHHPNRP